MSSSSLTSDEPFVDWVIRFESVFVLEFEWPRVEEEFEGVDEKAEPEKLGEPNCEGLDAKELIVEP